MDTSSSINSKTVAIVASLVMAVALFSGGFFAGYLTRKIAEPATPAAEFQVGAESYTSAATADQQLESLKRLHAYQDEREKKVAAEWQKAREQIQESLKQLESSEPNE